MGRTRTSKARLTVAATAAVGLVVGLVSTDNAGAAPASAKLAPGVATSHHSLKSAAAHANTTPRILANKGKGTLPAGVPASGNYAFLLKLSAKSTSSATKSAASKGTSARRAAAKNQLASVKVAQNRVISALPSKSRVLYRTHAAMSAVAVETNVKNYEALRSLSGVTAVYPIAAKTVSNSYAVPFQGAPAAWKAYGDRGEGTTIAVIDTGVDYTHSNFGGVGTVADYQAAKAQLGQPVSPNEFPGPKVVGGYDFAGDAYDPSSSNPAISTPAPDPYPLDCNGHGSHVAGTAAGLGENADGSTYTGPYNKNTPFDTMRIGPGVAPQASIYAYRVFGCEGTTNLVAEAIDRAADPNQDGDTSDHVDVINMSLGSDYGSPQDGDSVLTNEAAQLGITMVVASGNGGDLYDVGGSPGDAVRALTAANSQDAYSQDDSLVVDAPADLAGPYAALRSQAYDWATKPDLQGDVVALTDPANPDGCKPLNAADKALVAGKIVFEEWTDDDYRRVCGSVARGNILDTTDAVGFIFADDQNAFSAGITGSSKIPGVILAKDGADAMRAKLQAGVTVHISGTGAGDFKQLDESNNDTLSTSSSRGLGDAGNVKPDVGAVGTSVFSTGSGTGNEGLNDSGTSMASPMVAGTAALVVSKHPEWTVEQVKADIMNTADADLFTKTDHTGKKYAPQRVGSGRIDIKKALDNAVLAYNADDSGAVSVSFGPLEVTAPTVLTKHIKVQNTSNNSVSYGVSYKARTSIPGADYSVSPSTVSLDPRSSQTVTVTLTIDPAALTKTIDPTVDRLQGRFPPREYQADASGLVMLKAAGVPDLRVPVYSAPRPASVMTQPSSVTMPAGANTSAFLPLSGHSVNQGAGAEAVQSIVSGFELSATSPALPDCTATVTTDCASIPDQKAADLKYVGVTSDAQQLRSIGADPNVDGLTYFAITTQKPWRTPAGLQEFDILIDTNRDGNPDFVLFNTRLNAATLGTDVMVSELVDLNAGTIVDAQPINDRFGDTDTALLNSDTLVMPVATGALGLTATNSRFNWGVDSFSAYQSAPLDAVGIDAGSPLSFDPLNPGVALYGSYDGDASALLFRDSPGSVLKLTRNASAYAADKGLGLLAVHFHNTNGNKAQVVSFAKVKPAVKLVMAPNPVVHGKPTTVTITVTGSSGTPSGTVVLRRLDGAGAPALVRTATLVNGKATITYAPISKGTFHYRAEYSGNNVYTALNSATYALKIT